MNVSLIVTTYNRPDALDRVLASVAGLAVPHPEIVIADDGSDEKTEKLIAEWNKKLPVIHAWQPDDGFRAAMARNLSTKIIGRIFDLFGWRLPRISGFYPKPYSIS
jgi:glycosyltransferase involved in cell wall biosynthesis